MIYVGLDIAETMGVAIYYPDKSLAEVVEVKGLPYEQLEVLRKQYVPFHQTVVRFSIESLTHQRNAKTVRNLQQRIGYLKFSLIREGYKVNEVNINSVRHFLEAKNKKEVHALLSTLSKDELTDNHTDALAVALYQAKREGADFAWQLKIGRVK